MNNRLEVVFMGTPAICLPALKTLSDDSRIHLSSIVSPPSRKSGRGMQRKNPEVAQFAIDQKIPLLQTPNINKEDLFLEKLEKEPPDFILVFAFSQFLSDRILKLPKMGCFNIHTSLLPRYRGAAPIQYALLNGDRTTGLSIQRIVKKMDAGDVVASRSVDVFDEDDAISLQKKLEAEIPPIVNFLIENALGDSLVETPQNEQDVVMAPSISKEDGRLNFLTMTFKEIKNKLRAFVIWPGIFCFLNGKRLKILELEESSVSLSPGECRVDQGNLLVGALDGTAHLKRVQLEGKKPCSDKELLNGMRGKMEFS